MGFYSLIRLWVYCETMAKCQELRFPNQCILGGVRLAVNFTSFRWWQVFMSSELSTYACVLWRCLRNNTYLNHLNLLVIAWKIMFVGAMKLFHNRVGCNLLEKSYIVRILKLQRRGGFGVLEGGKVGKFLNCYKLRFCSYVQNFGGKCLFFLHFFSLGRGYFLFPPWIRYCFNESVGCSNDDEKLKIQHITKNLQLIRLSNFLQKF